MDEPTRPATQLYAEVMGPLVRLLTETNARYDAAEPAEKTDTLLGICRTLAEALERVVYELDDHRAALLVLEPLLDDRPGGT